MKRLLLILSLFSCVLSLPAQVDTLNGGYVLDYNPQQDTATVYSIFSATRKPEFPGGCRAFARYINDHINFTQAMADTLTRRKVYARIIIDRNGKVTLSVIAESSNKMLAPQVRKVLENLPSFIPGETKSGKRDFEVILIFEFTTNIRAASLKNPYVIPVFPTDNPVYSNLLNE